MKRILSALMPLLAVLVMAAPSAALVKWCKGDPIVELNGTQLQVFTAVPEEYVHLVNGPINIKFKTPKGVSRELIYTDTGFNGHGETVKFTDLTKGSVLNGSFTTQVDVIVPIDGVKLREMGANKVPVQLEIIPENGELMLAYGDAATTKMELQITGE